MARPFDPADIIDMDAREYLIEVAEEAKFLLEDGEDETINDVTLVALEMAVENLEDDGEPTLIPSRAIELLEVEPDMLNTYFAAKGKPL
jgi:hypothetical protein